MKCFEKVKWTLSFFFFSSYRITCVAHYNNIMIIVLHYNIYWLNYDTFHFKMFYTISTVSCVSVPFLSISFRSFTSEILQSTDSIKSEFFRVSFSWPSTVGKFISLYGRIFSLFIVRLGKSMPIYGIFIGCCVIARLYRFMNVNEDRCDGGRTYTRHENVWKCITCCSNTLFV